MADRYRQLTFHFDYDFSKFRARHGILFWFFVVFFFMFSGYMKLVEYPANKARVKTLLVFQACRAKM